MRKSLTTFVATLAAFTALTAGETDNVRAVCCGEEDTKKVENCSFDGDIAAAEEITSKGCDCPIRK